MLEEIGVYAALLFHFDPFTSVCFMALLLHLVPSTLKFRPAKELQFLHLQIVLTSASELTSKAQFMTVDIATR